VGLFDSPDKRLRDKLRPDVRTIAEAVCAEAHRFSVHLNFHQTRELEYVVFVAWLQAQIDEHGVQLIGDVTPLLLVTVLGQATRIGHHFTPEQGAAYDATVAHIKSNPNDFAVPAGPVASTSGRRRPEM
jgi:hypothetical protein